MMKNFLRKEDGSIIVEAALFMPIIAMLLLLSVETSRYILAHQKASRTTATVGDLLARSATPQSAIDDIVNVVGSIMQPFTLGSNSVMIASVVTRPTSATPTIIWQYRGAGNASAESRVGEEDGTPTFPDGFSLNVGETVVVTEFFYTYSPWFHFSFWDDKQIYNRTVYKPRLQSVVVN